MQGHFQWRRKIRDGRKISVITGSIARSAKHWYISYSKGDFEVYRPAGATRCTDAGEISYGGVVQSSTPPCQISSPLVQR